MCFLKLPGWLFYLYVSWLFGPLSCYNFQKEFFKLCLVIFSWYQVTIDLRELLKIILFLVNFINFLLYSYYSLFWQIGCCCGCECHVCILKPLYIRQRTPHFYRFGKLRFFISYMKSLIKFFHFPLGVDNCLILICLEISWVVLGLGFILVLNYNVDEAHFIYF